MNKLLPDKKETVENEENLFNIRNIFFNIKYFSISIIIKSNTGNRRNDTCSRNCKD